MSQPTHAVAALPAAPLGRLRLRPPGRSEAELRRLGTALAALPAVRSARVTPLTGSLLVHFDAGALDAATLHALVGGAGAAPPIPRSGGVACARRGADRVAALRRRPRLTPRARPRPPAAATMPRPPLTRVLWPVVHLLCAASPLGLALHVGEVCWAVWPFVHRWRPRTVVRARAR